jgi:hypothetical protein
VPTVVAASSKPMSNCIDLSLSHLMINHAVVPIDGLCLLGVSDLVGQLILYAISGISKCGLDGQVTPGVNIVGVGFTHLLIQKDAMELEKSIRVVLKCWLVGTRSRQGSRCQGQWCFQFRGRM